MRELSVSTILNIKLWCNFGATEKYRQNTENLLEAIEEDKDQARQSCQTWDKQLKGLEVGKQQERLLENLRQLYSA